MSALLFFNERVTSPLHEKLTSLHVDPQIEGVFEYISPMTVTKAGPSQITPGRHRHVFYRDSAVISLDTASEPTHKHTFKSALNSVRLARSLDRISHTDGPRSKSRPRKQASSAHLKRKQFHFDFALPRSDVLGEELPQTFSSSNIVSAGVRGRVYAESADVRYCVEAVWEALDGTGACSQYVPHA